MLTKQELLGGLILGVALGSSAFWWTRDGVTPSTVQPPRPIDRTSRPTPPPVTPQEQQALPPTETPEVIETATQPTEDAPQEERRPETPVPEPPRNEPPREKPPAAQRISTPENPPPRALGVLSVYTRPWSKVWVDGAAYGEAPLELELAAGRHEVVLRHDGQEVTLQVTITAGSTEKLTHYW